MDQQIQKLKSPLPLAVIIAGVIISGTLLYKDRDKGFLVQQKSSTTASSDSKGTVVEIPYEPSALEEIVVPAKGVILPVVWGRMGQNLILAGVIKANEFKRLYDARGVFTDEDEKLLFGTTTGNLVITSKNSGVLLNLFWALGLAQKSQILEKGEMTNMKYGGAQNFASTGGWTLAEGKAMDHYSYHTFFALTAEEESLVDKVSRGIFRPCCGNSVHFPDCNHGMAMLGLLELMASQGANEQDMWKTALAVNSYWFPETYVTIATYMKDKGIEWKNINPETILGSAFSSSSGYAKIAAQVALPQTRQNRGGCGVGSEEPVIAPKQQGGCAI